MKDICSVTQKWYPLPKQTEHFLSQNDFCHENSAIAAADDYLKIIVNKLSFLSIYWQILKLFMKYFKAHFSSTIPTI